MIRLSVFYPTTDRATFDHDYYLETHVPMACAAWGLESAEIDKGVSGPYVAGVHFMFDSMDALGAAMSAEGTGAVIADVAKFTSIQPVMQTSERVS
jgi:uncharacterized protein (TIGR02118 family)